MSVTDTLSQQFKLHWQSRQTGSAIEIEQAFE